MAPRKAKGNVDVNIVHATALMSNGAVKGRLEGVAELMTIFRHSHRSKALEDLKDGGYHAIYESLFQVAYEEKRIFLQGKSPKTKSNAEAVLADCASLLRTTIKAGIEKLKPKTLTAIIEHVTQLLPVTSLEYSETWSNGYVKALQALFEYEPHIEHMAAPNWLSVVEYCLEGIRRHGRESNIEVTLHSRSSTITNGLRDPTQASGTGSSVRPGDNAISGATIKRNAEDLLQCLLLLLSAPNAPIIEQAEDIIQGVVHFIRSQGSTVGQNHQAAFSTLNLIISASSADEIGLSESVALQVVPIIGQLWSSKTASQSEMLSAVRDEMMITLLLLRLHMRRLVRGEKGAIFKSSLDEVDTVLRNDYSERVDRDQLHVDDMDMTSMGRRFSERNTMNIGDLHLRPHALRAERKWAILQILSTFDSLLHDDVASLPSVAEVVDVDDQNLYPRKRTRLTRPFESLINRINAGDVGSRLLAMQTLLFALPGRNVTDEGLSNLIDVISPYIVDRRNNIASWAMLCVGCLAQKSGARMTKFTWVHLWHTVARLVTAPATCRAASHLLHVIISNELVHYQDINEGLDAIITATEVSGPANLCDSSLLLMTHLLRLRNMEVPRGSAAACQHVIRWLSTRWNPKERSFAARCAIDVHPIEILNLLRTCLGLPQVHLPVTINMPGGAIAQAWFEYMQCEKTNRYLLLLDNASATAAGCGVCNTSSEIYEVENVADTSAHTQATRRLLLDLLLPRFESLAEDWEFLSPEQYTQVSTDTFRCTVSTCVVGCFILSLVTDSILTQVHELEVVVNRLIAFVSTTISLGDDAKGTSDAMIQAIQPYVPAIKSSDLGKLACYNSPLLNCFSLFSAKLDELGLREAAAPGPGDPMDLDDMFADSQQSRSTLEIPRTKAARKDIAMMMSQTSFRTVTCARLILVSSISSSANIMNEGLSSLLGHISRLTPLDALSCRPVIWDILHGDLPISIVDASALVKFGGSLLSPQYSSCEVALGLCLDILTGLAPIWARAEDSQLIDSVWQLYQWFITVVIPERRPSTKVQIGLSNLLYELMRIQPTYGEGEGRNLPSPRSCLLEILQRGPLRVKFHIGDRIPEIFSLFVLKRHNDILSDILESLPVHADWMEGIAFRLYVLSKLASRWPTLLRQCAYYMLESSGALPESTPHATKCLSDVSSALGLANARDLFQLFASQLLFTWLEAESIDKLPYQIFGFATLPDLLRDNKEEIAALMIMRNHDDDVQNLADLIGISVQDILLDAFSRIMAYSIAYDVSIPQADTTRKYVSGEARVRKRIGKELFLDLLNRHFADIISLFHNLIDQDEHIEKAFERDPNLAYAVNAMIAIKTMNASNTVLPPNHQPSFKAKYLTREIQHLCSRTPFQITGLYTPSLFVFIVRRLLSTIHTALGSLHTCSVLRKVRILLSLAGPSALKGYPLEMLLHSMRPFMADAECADDAIGITQYLLDRGSPYLSKAPSFVAGISLSILASIRVFLDSSPASTTQESQYRSTLSKAETFHSWLGSYLTNYKTSVLDGSTELAFRKMMQAACRIHSVGNAEVGTAESNLLLEILEDQRSVGQLLNKPSRDLAFSLLYTKFEAPKSFRTDICGSDELAIENAGTVWDLCGNMSSDAPFLVWAGKVLGRAFTSTGTIYPRFLQESGLKDILDVGTSSMTTTSKTHLLRLLELQTQDNNSNRAGLAETALRVLISTVEESGDPTDAAECQEGLSKTLLLASVWSPYHVPPMDFGIPNHPKVKDPFAPNAIDQPHWLRNLTMTIIQSVESDAILHALTPLLSTVDDFAEEAFPFILHQVLLLQFDMQKYVKQHMSTALRSWLSSSKLETRSHLKLLINALLYLRTQPLPRESSIADRVGWLDVDFIQAGEASVRCGMYKTALLFMEISASESARNSSRRSSVKLNEKSDVLLSVFENIDDPDIFYGLEQAPGLQTVLTRLEYEKDGLKSLNFRGAQYDTHLRRQDKAALQDSNSLVNALGALSLDGLSHSLLQSQETVGMNVKSINSMYHTARKLEQWDLPVPTACDNDSVLIYKVFQGINSAATYGTMTATIDAGLSLTMMRLRNASLGASTIHSALQSLAVLTEMDEILSGSNSEQFEELMAKFQSRSSWMKTGKLEDISQILSCRETVFSSLSQQVHLRNFINVGAADTRLVEVHTTLLSAKLNRAHDALQDSLQSATYLTSLITPCHDLGLHIDAVAHLEAANALWDQGEISSSIGMLKSLDASSGMKKQTIPIGKSDLLAKIAYQVSEARLERSDSIIQKYLEPALKELKGKAEGSEAGQVFHEFAAFCDRQFEDPDSLGDLERLRKLKEMKESEVHDLGRLTKTASSTEQKTKFHGHFIKAKQWLQLDTDEFRRLSTARDDLLRQSLENYLLALAASDDHNNDALRFAALWLEHSEEILANDSVAKRLDKVPSRKFASLTNQLTSRLLNSDLKFQQLLFSLVLRICTDHPFHGMYQVWAGAKNKANPKDEMATSRSAATNRIAQRLENAPQSASVWSSISMTSKFYCRFAAEKEQTRYKAGQKIQLKSSPQGSGLSNVMSKFPLPPPTLHVPIAADLDYSRLPVMQKLEPYISIASGVSAPKIITVVASNGSRYKQLVKGGADDLRQDAIMEQVFGQVSELLGTNTATRQRNLGIRTYKVLPLSSTAGIIEFVSNTIPLHEYLMPAHGKYYPKDATSNQCRKAISDAQPHRLEVRVKAFRAATDKFHPVMRYFFLEKFPDPDEWFKRRTAYTRSTAANSILGHVLGLGDRHGHNILLDEKTGEVVHIDLGVAFETGRVLPVPELVPFRLTRDIVDGMGTTKTEGVFRRCCEFTLEALRKEAYSIVTILDVLRYDPLYNWSISPVRLAKLQEAQSAAPAVNAAVAEGGNAKAREAVNEPSEADRALTVVKKKLSKTLSVTATVNDLINQASDEKNLAVLYAGWAAYA